MSAIQTQLKSLMQQEMTRKDFLRTLGIALLILLNIEPFLRLFGKGHGNLGVSDNDSYGGRRRE